MNFRMKTMEEGMDRASNNQCGGGKRLNRTKEETKTVTDCIVDKMSHSDLIPNG